MAVTFAAVKILCGRKDRKKCKCSTPRARVYNNFWKLRVRGIKRTTIWRINLNVTAFASFRVTMETSVTTFTSANVLVRMQQLKRSKSVRRWATAVTRDSKYKGRDIFARLAQRAQVMKELFAPYVLIRNCFLRYESDRNIYGRVTTRQRGTFIDLLPTLTYCLITVLLETRTSTHPWN